MVKIIVLGIFFLFMYILFAPNSIVVKVNIKADEYFTNITRLDEMENSIKIKLLKVIPVYNQELFAKNGKKKKETKKNDTLLNKNFVDNVVKRLIKKAKLDKFVLSLGFNLDDPIANSYVNASLNTILCMYIIDENGVSYACNEKIATASAISVTYNAILSDQSNEGGNDNE